MKKPMFEHGLDFEVVYSTYVFSSKYLLIIAVASHY